MVRLAISKDLAGRKNEVLSYLRYRSDEAAARLLTEHGARNFRPLAGALNKAILEEKDRLAAQLLQQARAERWSNAEILPCMLTLRHCGNATMLASRHAVWPYDYMTFSRRVGEIWEPFVRDCIEYPLRRGVSLYVPPLFEDVRMRLASEMRSFIEALPISGEQKSSLLAYYDKVWSLVTCGEVQLALDLHFAIKRVRLAVDCKSGFGSNEKGNTNRLLLVASVYKNIEPEEYRCVMLVRSEEERNNHYLLTLKRSGLWEVYCSSEAYERVREFSGFDLKAWIDASIDWRNDLGDAMYGFLEEHELERYLAW